VVIAGDSDHDKNCLKTAAVDTLSWHASSSNFLSRRVLAPLRRGFSFSPVVHAPRTLAQRDLRFWPSSDGRPIRCHCGLEVVDASDVLDDIVTGTIPNVDAETEIGLRLHGGRPTLRLCKAAGLGLARYFTLGQNKNRGTRPTLSSFKETLDQRRPQ
jgi:hypothetical protein